MLDIRGLLSGLAESREVFHSEADFQHALAWHIHQKMEDSQIRLEFPMPLGDRKMYVDIWLPVEKIAIELKYVTRSLELENNEESFALRNHGAHDLRRYDFLRDIQRLERMRSNLELCEAGHAVLLTNDPSYWNLPRRFDTVDSDFRIHEEQVIAGELTWDPRASSGTMRGRESPIRIGGSYRLCWQDFCDFPGEPSGRFRYLAVSVY